MHNKQAMQYLEQQIQNASPAQQIVMLYDGAIKFCRKAAAAIEEGNIQERCNNNVRVIEIVSYLLEILDVEKGGEVAERLQRIYTYMLKRLLEVDLKNSIEAVKDVESHLIVLRKSWDELSKEGVGTTPQQEATPTSPKAKTAVGSGDNPPIETRSAIA